MTHLINLRQRIKTVETVKKTTNAMRLIAMSTHSRVRQQQEQLIYYRDTLAQFLSKSLSGLSDLVTEQDNGSTLVILIGSQKGLCGAFNTALYKYFLMHKPAEYKLIVLGKQMHNLVQKTEAIGRFYDIFSLNNYIDVAQELCTLEPLTQYHKVLIFYQEQKTFFLQRPTIKQLWPLATPSQSDVQDPISFEEKADILYHKLLSQYISIELKALFLHSLLAEQAGRFLSMDSATRNADTLLNTMKLDYNKLRQAQITRELTDLSGSMDL